MKLRNFLAMMAVGCIATGFTACDDDDDDAPAMVNLAGDFYGVNVESMDVMPQPGYDSTCVSRVVAQPNGKYTVVLPASTDQTEGGMAMPAMSIKDVAFAAEGNAYVATIAETTINVMAGKDAIIKDFKAVVNPAAKTLDLTCSVKYGKMPFFVNNAFRTLFQNDFLVGNFFGNNAAHVGDTQMPDSAVIATIALQENGKYAVTLPAKAKDAKGMEMPAVTVPDVVFDATANVYTFAIAETTVATPGMSILLKDMKGEVHGNKFTLSYEMKPGKMPMFVSNAFEGGKLAK